MSTQGLADTSASLDPEDGDGDRKPRVQSAKRTIDVVLAVAQSVSGIKAKDLSDQLKLPRQTIYHLLHTLEGTGAVRRNDQNRYVLGLAAGIISEGFLRQLSPSEHFSPRVRSLVEATGETAYAAGWVDDGIAVLTTARGYSAVQVAQFSAGYMDFAHTRASGKMLLALAEPAVRERYLSKSRLPARTSRSITTAKELAEELQQIADQGYAVDLEEYADGACCLAVPIAGLSGRYVLCLSVPAERFHDNFDFLLRTLREHAGLAA